MAGIADGAAGHTRRGLKMEFTGERFVPGVGGEIRLEHLHRYAFALAYARGKRVLDVACGEGYGSAMLASVAAHVTGVDISAEAVTHAAQRYSSIENLRFRVGDAANLKLPGKKFDVITSFETLEHLEDHEGMLSCFARLLSPTGVVIVSSPDKRVYSDEPGYRNEFHVKELYLDELRALIRRHFKRHRLFGQRLAGGSAIYPVDDVDRARKASVLVDDGSEMRERSPRLADPVYLIAFATNAASLPAPQTSVVLSESNDPLQALKKIARWASGVHQEMEELKARSSGEIERLNGLLGDMREASARLAESQESSRGQIQGLEAARAEVLEQLEEARRGRTADVAALELRLEEAGRQLEAERARGAEAQQRSRAEIEGLQASLGDALAKLEAARHDSLRRIQDVEAQLSAAHREIASIGQERDRMASESARLQEDLRTKKEIATRLAEAHRRELELLRSANESVQALHSEEIERMQRQADQIDAAWTERLREQGATFSMQFSELEGRFAKSLADEARRWGDRLASSEAALERVQSELSAALQSWREEQGRWEVERSALQADAAARLTRLTEEAREQQARAKRDAELELQWWQGELTESRRQLQEVRLGQHRQAESAARGLRQLQQQHEDQLATLRAQVLQGRMELRAVGEGIGLQTELLRWGSPSDREVEAAQVLRQVQVHAQCAARALDEALSVLSIEAPAPSSWTLGALMALDDDAFVAAAYRCVLHREADASGRAHYVARLAQGTHRLRVLSDLRQSPEGKALVPAVAGLDEALRASRQPQWARLLKRKRTDLSQVCVQATATAMVVGPSGDRPGEHERLQRIEDSVADLGRGTALLAEAVPIAVSLSRAPRESGLDPWACAQEMVRAGDRDFIDLAFNLLLHRPPQALEARREQGRLGAGASRVHVIELLLEQARSGGQLGGAGAYRSRALLALGGERALPHHDRPEVSIVVAAHARLDYTLRCLESIVYSRPALPFEVIVVDDTSTEHSSQVLSQVPGIHLVSHPEMGGLGATFNSGARRAKGPWLVFLKPDTQVQPGWLEELRCTFDIFPGAAIAGPKLLRPDGRIRSAGQILRRDGEWLELGEDAAANAQAWSYAREVDACAGACLMVPRVLFDAAGGFREEPACSGVEAQVLALGFRQRGYRTIYQPMARVSWHDLPHEDELYRPAQPVPREFVATVLEASCPAESSVQEAAAHHFAGRLLAIEHRMPRPDRDAGSVTVFNLMMTARALGLHVSLLAEADVGEGVELDARAAALLQRSGVEVVARPEVEDVASYLADQGQQFDVVVLFRPVVMERLGVIVERHCPRARRIYYPHDLHFLRLARQAQVTGDARLAAAASEQERRELAMHRHAHRCLVASQAELAWLEGMGQAGNATWLPLMLDTAPAAAVTRERKHMLFVGGFHHAPNVDALRVLLEDIMPRLRARRPDIELLVVGEAPPGDLVARGDPGVSYAGAVDDLMPFLARARVAVAPLRFGAGAKGKVARPLAAGLPVVASALALEGMGLQPGDQVLQADDADAVVDAVIHLHDDDVLWERLSRSGRAYAELHWGPKAGSRNLAQILRECGVVLSDRGYGARFFSESTFFPAPRQHRNLPGQYNSHTPS